MKYWVIVKADGTVQQVMSNVKPAAANGVDVTNATYIGEVPRIGNLSFEVLNATKTDWISNLTSVKTLAIKTINDERERRQMLVMTEGGAKKFIYSQKADEVRAYFGLGATVALITATFNALAIPEKNRRFPFAMKQMAKTGQTLAQVMTEFDNGAQASVGEVARIESVARGAIDAIKAATTVPQVTTALSAVNWNWGT